MPCFVLFLLLSLTSIAACSGSAATSPDVSDAAGQHADGAGAGAQWTADHHHHRQRHDAARDHDRGRAARHVREQRRALARRGRRGRSGASGLPRDRAGRFPDAGPARRHRHVHARRAPASTTITPRSACPRFRGALSSDDACTERATASRRDACVRGHRDGHHARGPASAQDPAASTSCLERRGSGARGPRRSPATTTSIASSPTSTSSNRRTG